jgi:hypothetical protein
MVPRNDFNDKLKWNLITQLLILIRFSNTFITTKKKESFTEAVGRTIGWWSLWMNRSKIKNWCEFSRFLIG